MPLEELYDQYCVTLSMCGMCLLEADDETIEYKVFEEFDIGCITFFHKNALHRLYDGKFISEDEMADVSNLRCKVLNLQDEGLWDLENFRKENKWKEVLELCDKIKNRKNLINRKK